MGPAVEVKQPPPAAARPVVVDGPERTPVMPMLVDGVRREERPFVGWGVDLRASGAAETGDDSP